MDNKNNGLPNSINKVSNTIEEVKRISSMSSAALAREVAANSVKDREVNDTEVKVYKEVKENMTKMSVKDIPNYIKDISKEVGTGDGVGAAAMAIADKFFPSDSENAKLLNHVKQLETKEMDINSSYDLYSEAHVGFEVDDIKGSDAYKEAALNQSLKTNLAMVAATVIERNAHIASKDNALGTQDEIVNTVKDFSPEALEELPPIDFNPSNNNVFKEQEKTKEVNSNIVKDTSPPIDNAKNVGFFDASKNRKENAERNAKARLTRNVQVNSPEVTGYFPYSNLKFKMDPTNSVLELEDDFSEIEKMYDSEGLSNMSKFITSASNHVELLTGDSDKKIINPGDNLRTRLHFMDFKYLLIAKALSSGETSLDVNITCPNCLEEYNLDLDIKRCLALFPEEMQKSCDTYDAGKTWEELTENWRTKETGTVVQKFDEPILDQFTKKHFDKVVYTLNYTEPTIDKYMKIKDAAIALLTFVFRADITPEMMANEVILLRTLHERYPVRVSRLQGIMESFTLIDSITISYFDTRSGSDVLIITDEIEISNFTNVADLYDLVTVYLPKEVLREAREYLTNKYNLEDIRVKMSERAQVPLEEVPMPTLLDEMTQISMQNLTCSKCGHVHAAEASVLFLGFSLAEKSMLKINI